MPVARRAPRGPGRHDLAGLRGRLHVVGQIERGEGAVGLGAVDSDLAVF